MSEMIAFFSSPLGPLCLILLIAGAALLIVEMCIPGFGAPGIFGVICFIAAVVVQFVGNTARGALTFTACVFILLLLLLILFLRSFRNGALSRSRFVNKTAVREEPAAEETPEQPAIVTGMKGKALTALRPAGIVELGGRRINAETDGTFLSAGTAVEVTQVKGLGIIVHEVL